MGSESDGGEMSMPAASISLPGFSIVKKRRLTRIVKKAVVAAPVLESFADLEDE